MMEAQCELKAKGLPYPRTCPVCKLGPCTRMVTVPKIASDSDMTAAAILLRNRLSARVAEIVTQGDMSAAKALVDQPVWRFLGEIIGDLETPDAF